MGNKDNNRVSDNSVNKLSDSQSIVVAKGDGFVIAYVLMFVFFVSMSLVGAYHIGKLTEKVILLEDIVLVNGIYKHIEIEKDMK